MGKWESKLETETGPWHNLLDRQDIRDLAQPVHVSLQKIERNKTAETGDILTLNKCL